MRTLSVIALVLFACEPQQGAQGPLTQVATTTQPPRADACREDIPDCSAVCALRETNRTEFIDFYERRCAAVILGRNPDKIDLQATPYTSDGGTPSNTAYPPEVRASLMIPPAATVFDPSAMPRTGGNEPAECKAARILRSQRHDREAETMEALCLAKGGGDAGT